LNGLALKSENARRGLLKIGPAHLSSRTAKQMMKR
jgi:hypothetical protein